MQKRVNLNYSKLKMALTESNSECTFFYVMGRINDGNKNCNEDNLLYLNKLHTLPLIDQITKCVGRTNSH